MNDVIDIKPQPRTSDRVHPEYASMSLGQKRDLAFNKLQGFIDKGKANAAAALQRIMSEQIDDRLVRASSMTFRTREDDGTLVWDSGQAGMLRVHPHAMTQFSERVKFPAKYLHELDGSPWGRELIAKNLNSLYAHAPFGDKLLVRAVATQVRGVLSNSYRPEDSRPAIDALIGVARESGAIVTEGSALDTRVSIKIMQAEPVELFEGEWAVFGLDYRTSDYGNGAREMMGWVLRLVCLNGASVVANYRRVHLGGRMQDEVEYSNKTRTLNSAASASAARDVAKALLGPEAVKKMIGQVRASHEAALNPDAALAQLKKDVSKEEAKLIVDKFNSPDVELLPPGQNQWRWSNAISWLATQTGDADRRLDLERLAGNALAVAA